jgi:MoaA/NifB/PqqE/SkfB family radical SAM enzyme
MAISATAIASSPQCCSHPLLVKAPVDRLLPAGLMLRHLPSVLCLRCRNITVPEILPVKSLEDSIRACLAGDPTSISIIRIRSGEENESNRTCQSCAQRMGNVALDVGIGKHAGLVIEGLRGSECRNCGTAVVHGGGDSLKAHLNYLDFSATGELVPSLLYDTPCHPRSVQLEVTTRCNLKCDYCSHRHLPLKADLAFEEFQRYLDRIDFTQVDNVDFTGLGEPVLHPDLPRMIAEVRRRGTPSEVRVVTNGTILDSRRISEICDAGITSIAFSIDSLDPTRFARARGGADLHRILKNLEALVDYRDNHDLDDLHVKIKTVLVGDPYFDAEQLLSYSARLGIEMPHFSCLDSREAAQPIYEQSWLENNWVREDDGRAFTGWAADRWLELTSGNGSVREQLQRNRGKRSSEFIDPRVAPDPSLCRWAVDAAFISASGESLPCCEQMIDLPRTYWGSLKTKSLAELWTGDLLWGYRLPLSLGRVPKGCMGCPSAPADGIPILSFASQQSDRTSPPA